MGANTEGLLNKLPTVTACLCGIVGVHSYDLMTGSRSLIFKDIEKRSPGSIHDRFRQMMIFHHIRDLKVFHRNALIAFSIGFGDFEMMVSTLTVNLQVRFGNIARCLTKPLTAFLMARECTLLASKRLLRRAIETGVRDGLAFTVSQEGLQSNINTDVRMRTFTRSMVGIRFSLAHDERIPMSIRSQDKMDGFRLPFYWAMQFDLERLAQLGRYDEVFLVLMQIAIFAILPELDRMPPIGFLEAGETALLTQFFHGKKVFECLGEPVSKHLHRGGWYVFLALPLELCFQFVLVRKGASLLILLLGYCSHLIIDTARFCQTGDKFGVLLLIYEKAILKCSHTCILQYIIRVVERDVRLRRRRFTSMRERRGPHAAVR